MQDGNSTVGGRGMIVVGADTIFASYLPAFREPDDYQAIFQIDLSGNQYLDERAHFGAFGFFTLRLDTLMLADLDGETSGRPMPKEFGAQLFRGHFAKGGDRLAHVTVGLREVCYFQHFHQESRDLPELRYILFGQGQELFLAHQITKPPDFDQILMVQNGGMSSLPLDTKQALTIGFPDRDNRLDAKLAPFEQVKGISREQSGPGASSAEIDLQVGGEAYLETAGLVLD